MAVVKACDVKVNASVQINNLCMNSRQLSNGAVGRQFQQLPPPRSAFNFLDTNCILALAKK